MSPSCCSSGKHSHAMNGMCGIDRRKAEGPFRPHSEEIERGGWFAPAEVTRRMAEQPGEFVSALLLIWKRVNRELR